MKAAGRKNGKREKDKKKKDKKKKDKKNRTKRTGQKEQEEKELRENEENNMTAEKLNEKEKYAMKHRKHHISFVCIAATVLLVFLLPGCERMAAVPQENKQTVIRMGWLEKSDSELQALARWREEWNIPQDDPTIDQHSYPSLGTMLMDLKAGRIEEIMIPACTARYILKQNNDFVEVTPTHTIYDDYRMATRGEDSTLCQILDSSIREIAADGTLDALVRTYITDMAEPPKFEIITPVPGALTYKVGVTGDLAPLDFVSEDGRAAGFNVALLKAISQKAGINFETVPVEMPARMSALAAGKIDVVFWMGYTHSANFMPDSAGLNFTESYHSEPLSAMRINPEKKAAE